MYPCNRDAEGSSGTAGEHVLRTMTCRGGCSDFLSGLITTVKSSLSLTNRCWMQTAALLPPLLWIVALKLTSVSPTPNQTVGLCVLA